MCSSTCSIGGIPWKLMKVGWNSQDLQWRSNLVYILFYVIKILYTQTLIKKTDVVISSFIITLVSPQKVLTSGMYFTAQIHSTHEKTVPQTVPLRPYSFVFLFLVYSIRFVVHIISIEFATQSSKEPKRKEKKKPKWEEKKREFLIKYLFFDRQTKMIFLAYSQYLHNQIFRRFKAKIIDITRGRDSIWENLW